MITVGIEYRKWRGSKKADRPGLTANEAGAAFRPRGFESGVMGDASTARPAHQSRVQDSVAAAVGLAEKMSRERRDQK
jgi:hypothetical protein